MAEQDLMEKLAALFLSGQDGKDDEKESPKKDPVIQPLDLHGIASRIKKIFEQEDKMKILVMTGAGISTAAGIPDFRSPGTGLYDNLQKYNLPDPQAVFQIDYLKENPKPFFLLAKELYPGNFKPTMSHYFIRLLAEKGLLLRNFTQNIDTLERRAGIDPKFLVEAHGNFHDAHCIACHKSFTHEFVKEMKILVMTGAGISTAAGIPDFRSPGTGLYDNLQKYNLPDPQAVFQIDYLKENPKPFFLLAKELYPGNFKPTMSHYFIRLLAEKGLLLRNFTQNIDTLERRAGIDPKFLVEAHGNFHDAHCIACHKSFTHEFVKEHVFRDEVPRCKSCGDIVKPDIVFFGEALPDRFANLLMSDSGECELLIVMGTSLVVYPFASLADRVREDCPRLLINREKVHEKKSDFFSLMMGGGSGFDFSEETGYRDVFYAGDCDHGVVELAKLLGWEDELKELYSTHHAQLDSEMESEKLKTKSKDSVQDTKEAKEEGKKVDVEKN
jgi:NAD-dependent deacetylase sirtuin 2